MRAVHWAQQQAECADLMIRRHCPTMSEAHLRRRIQTCLRHLSALEAGQTYRQQTAGILTTEAQDALIDARRWLTAAEAVSPFSRLAELTGDIRESARIADSFAFCSSYGERQIGGVALAA